jgi:hypothetical protein
MGPAVSNVSQEQWRRSLGFRLVVVMLTTWTGNWITKAIVVEAWQPATPLSTLGASVGGANEPRLGRDSHRLHPSSAWQWIDARRLGPIPFQNEASIEFAQLKKPFLIGTVQRDAREGRSSWGHQFSFSVRLRIGTNDIQLVGRGSWSAVYCI